MNIRTRQWDSEMPDLFQVEKDKLGDLIQPGSVLGYTTKAIRKITDIPTGIPLISAGGAQQCAALGDLGRRRRHHGALSRLPGGPAAG